MSDPIDMSKETRVEWDKEIDAGNLVRADPTRSNRALDQHVQGVPLTDAEASRRVIPADQARRMMDEAQRSSGGAYRMSNVQSSGKTSVICNWPFPRAPKPPTT